MVKVTKKVTKIFGKDLKEEGGYPQIPEKSSLRRNSKCKGPEAERAFKEQEVNGALSQ